MTFQGLLNSVAGFQSRGGQKTWKDGSSPHLHGAQQQDTPPDSLGMPECWSLGALWSICSPAALFYCTHWHQIAVAGRQKQMLFDKSCNMRLNILQLNIGNITKNTRPNKQVSGKVQHALRAASTWPESFVVSSLSLFFWLLSHNILVYLLSFALFCLLGLVL